MSDHPKTILILGKGYISNKLNQHIPRIKENEYNIISVSKEEANYVNPTILEDLIYTYNPVAIINTYGMTGRPNIDQCESSKDKCRKLNVEDTIAIIRNSLVPVINISSGCIYDGYDKVYNENDFPNFGTTNPEASYYSKTKAEFDAIFQKEFETDHINLRIRMPFDEDLEDSKNYLSKLLKYDKLLNYPNSVTYLKTLAEVIVKFVDAIHKDFTDSPRGTYNVVNTGGIDANKILHIFFKHGIEKEIDRFYTVEELQKARFIKARRSNCVLSNERLVSVLNYRDILTGEEAIDEAIKIYKGGNE